MNKLIVVVRLYNDVVVPIIDLHSNCLNLSLVAAYCCLMMIDSNLDKCKSYRLDDCDVMMMLILAVVVVIVGFFDDDAVVIAAVVVIENIKLNQR